MQTLNQPKVNKKKKDGEMEEIKEKIEGKQDGEPQQKLLTSIKEEITNLFNYSNRNSSKSKKMQIMTLKIQNEKSI